MKLRHIGLHRVFRLLRLGLAAGLWLCALSACQELTALFHNGPAPLARIGRHVLSTAEVENLLPEGLSRADSVNRMRDYANSWALDILMLQRAEQALSKEEKDVRDELDKYRKSLLLYRYQQKYLAGHLDTLVTPQQVADYFQANQDRFRLKDPLFKVHSIKMRNLSPYLDLVRALYASADEEQLRELETLCQKGAEVSTTYQDRWVDAPTLGRDLPLTATEIQNALLQKRKLETRDSLYTYLVHCFDLRPAGDPAPLEYKQTGIKETLLTQRKQTLLRQLEAEVLTQGWDSQQIKLYLDNEK